MVAGSVAAATDRSSQQRSGSIAHSRDLDGSREAGPGQDSHSRPRYPQRRRPDRAACQRAHQAGTGEPSPSGCRASSRERIDREHSRISDGRKLVSRRLGQRGPRSDRTELRERVRALAQSLSLCGPSARAAPQDHRRPRATGRRAQSLEAPAGTGGEPDSFADRGRRHLRGRLLLVPLLRGRRIPARLQLPTPSTVSVRARPRRQSRAATSSSRARASWRSRSSDRVRWSITKARVTASTR